MKKKFSKQEAFYFLRFIFCSVVFDGGQKNVPKFLFFNTYLKK